MRNSEHLANVMVQAFIDAVNEGIDLVPVVADSTSTAKIAPFIKQFPDRLVNVGIAEQSMVGTAAGLGWARWLLPAMPRRFLSLALTSKSRLMSATTLPT